MDSKVEKFRPAIAPYLEPDPIWKRDPYNPKTSISRMVERIGVYMWNTYFVKWEFGLAPREYNFRVHGPYVPWRYYGKLDTPFFDVKVKELPAWLARRDLSPYSGVRAISRAYYYWVHRTVLTKYKNLTYVWQLGVLIYITMHMYNADAHVWRRKARYHW